MSEQEEGGEWTRKISGVARAALELGREICAGQTIADCSGFLDRRVARTAAILVLCARLLAPAPGTAVEFFVAPDGDDADPGSRQQPFASLERNPEAPGGTFGKLYLWPPEKLDSAEIMLSLHGGDGAALVRLDSVRHVRFEGLTFELTRGDGIVIEHSREVVIDRCVLRNIGGQGIVTEGCTRVGLLDSELYGIGSEAVRLSGPGGAGGAGGGAVRLRAGGNILATGPSSQTGA